MAHFQLTILVKDKLKRISSNVLRVIIENKEQVGFFTQLMNIICALPQVL